MAHVVKLHPEDRLLLVAMLYESMIIKEERLLKTSSSIKKMKEEYLDAAEKLVNQEYIDCGKQGTKNTDNFFGWLKDNLSYTKSRIESKTKLTDDERTFLEYVDQALKITNYAAKGEYRVGRQFRTLFEQ